MRGDITDRHIHRTDGTGEAASGAKDVLRRQAALIDLSYDPIFVWDMEAGITEWNAGAERLYGYSREEALGQVSHRLLQTFHLAPFSEYFETLEREGFWTGELQHHTKDGSEVFVESRQQLVESDGRRLVLETNRDITERYIETRRLVLLAVVGEFIRTQTDPAELLFNVSKAVGEHFKVRRCLFNEIDLENDLETVHRDYCHEVESVAGEHKISDYSPITSADMRAGRTVVNADSKTDPRTAKLYRKVYDPAGERSYVAVPLMRNGRWVASLWLSDDEPRAWSDVEITLLETISERVWVAVEKLRSESILDRYRLLSERATDVIWFIYPNGDFVDVNRAAVETYGYTRDEFLKMNILDLRHPDTREEFPKQLSAAGTVGIHFETLHVRKDGTPFPVEVNANGAEFGGGLLMMAIVRDISERRKADEALKKSEEIFSKFMQHLPGLAWVKDLNGRYVYANEAAETAFRIPREELYGKTDDEVFSPEIAAQFRENDQRIVDDGKGLQMVETLEHSDGPHHSIVSKFPISDPEGRVELIGGMAVDVTDRMRAEEALREAEERSQLAQEAGRVGIFDWDIPAGKTYWSETMWSFYGEERRDINPDEEFWSAHLHPSDRERVKNNIRRAVRSSDDEFADEFRIVRKDGSIRWVEAKANISRDDAGKAFRMYGVNLDITARKDSEERTRLSENQLRLVTNAVPALLAYTDSRERYRFVNQKFTEWFGMPTGEIVGKKVKDIYGLRAYKTIKPKIDEALSGKQCTFEAVIDYKKAGTRYVNISYIPDLGVDGTVYGYYGLTLDLTDLKRSQDLLRSSEERIALMMESAVDYAIFSMDKEGHINSWNRGAEIIFGYTQDEILGRASATIYTAEDVELGVPSREMKTARQKGRASDDRWHLRKDGTRFYASGVMMPLYVGQKLTGYAKIASDLTEKKRHAEELQQARDELELRVQDRTVELARSNLALLQQIEEREIAEKQRIDLLRRLVNSQEFERRRIARDLHDQLGQRLTALRLKIASLLEASAGHSEIESRVGRLQEIAEQLDSEVSFLAWELRPTALDDLGLVDAVGTFVKEWSTHHEIPADFHSSGLSKERLDHETETHLYRITQEALNNISKHAGAKYVTVLLEKRDGDVMLIIEDDGKGFDPTEERNPAESGRGLGLVGMRERAALVGGDLEIESAVGKGTTIYGRVPISP